MGRRKEEPIEITEADVLAANLRALGIDHLPEHRSHKEIIFEAIVSRVRERKQPVGASDIARDVNLPVRRVCDVLAQLTREGRMFRLGTETRPRYVPRVV